MITIGGMIDQINFRLGGQKPAWSEPAMFYRVIYEATKKVALRADPISLFVTGDITPLKHLEKSEYHIRYPEMPSYEGNYLDIDDELVQAVIYCVCSDIAMKVETKAECNARMIQEISEYTNRNDQYIESIYDATGCYPTDVPKALLDYFRESSQVYEQPVIDGGVF